VHIGKA
jgi:hypothetical protein